MSNLTVLLLPVLMCLCVGAGAAAIAGAIFYFVRRSSDELNRDWRNLGITTGLTLKPGGVFSQPELSGIYRRRPVRLYLYNAGTEGQRITYTALSLTVKNPANSRLEITPSSSVGNFFGKMLKAQDVEIGNPAFDARFVVRSEPADFASTLLGEPGIQAKILEIPDSFRIELSGTSLKYSKRGLEEDAELLVRLFNTLSDVADRLDNS